VVEHRSPQPVSTPIVWQAPSDRRRSTEQRFLSFVGVSDRSAGYRWSIESPEEFWAQVIDFLAIPFLQPPTNILEHGADMADARWFTGGSINLAHACLAKWVGSDIEALVEEREDGSVRTWTGKQLCDAVQRGAALLQQENVHPGDRVVLLLPMSAEGVISFLSVAWAGAVAVPVFSGFGVDATRLRIVDSGASAVVTQAGLTRRGRQVDLVSVAIEASTETTAADRLLIWNRDEGAAVSSTMTGNDWEACARAVEPLTTPVATAAEDPVLIAYTSGTTGKPKGVVHVHGGLTVKLAQEAAFQLDVQAGDRIAWITDLGWIMSAWVTVGALVNQATLVCYPGAPDFPKRDRVFDFARNQHLTALGLAPSLIRGLMVDFPQGFGSNPLPDLLAFGSSGEPWTTDAWRWLFEGVGGGSIPIVNFTGGTEVGACFLSVSLMQGIKPLTVGTPCWGMAVEDWGAEGEPTSGEPGELVCTQPWPAMARTVWGDHERFLDTYYSTWPGVWRHGDRVSFDADGFWTLHGRSDDVMNVAGKRLGPVEVEAAALTVPDVVQAAAVGLPHPTKGEAVALFLVLLEPWEDHTVPDEIEKAVTEAVVGALGKPFAPTDFVCVPDLPRTRTAKTVRRAIRSLALGEDPGDLSTVDNPEVLERFPQLRSAETP